MYHPHTKKCGTYTEITYTGYLHKILSYHTDLWMMTATKNLWDMEGRNNGHQHGKNC